MYLSKRFREAYGPLPRNYLSFDCETTGVHVSEDVPWEVGFTLVEDGEVRDNRSIVLNWHLVPDLLDPGDFDSRMLKTKRQMGEGCQYTEERMHKEGLHPAEGLTQVRQILARAISTGYALMGFNALFYDAPLLEIVLDYWLDKPLELPRDRIYDCGVLFRAQLNKMCPQPEESMEQFFRRARYRGTQCKWNCELCLDTYGLMGDHNLDRTKLHRADYDSYANYLIFESQRCQMEKTIAASSP